MFCRKSLAVLLVIGLFLPLMGLKCQDDKTYQIINLPATNNAPTVTAIADQTAVAGTYFVLDVATAGSVADDNDEISDLHFAVVSGGGLFSGSTYFNVFTLGTNVVEFTIIDSQSESTTGTFTVDAYDLPVAEFSTPDRSGVGSLVATFTDDSTGSPTAWSWDFGDGVGTSTSQNPIYAYTAPGIYTVTLEVTNQVGTDTRIKTDYITVYAVPDLPVADFTVNSYSFNSTPAAATFTDMSTGNVTTWAWDFNDDGVFDSYVQNPAYTFNTPGYHTIKLTVSNGAGSSTKSRTIFVATGVWYVNPGATGSDTNDGMTPASPFKTIGHAVEVNPLLAAGNIIWLADGTYDEYEIDLPEFGICIASISGNPANCVIDGDDEYNAFYLEFSVSPITISGIKFFDCEQEDGGAIDCEDGKLNIHNCIFESGYCDWGGAIYAEDSTILITDSTFLDNIAESYGGALFLSGGNCDISGCTFDGNNAGNKGGAIIINGGNLNISSSTFTDNSSYDDSGAIGASYAVLDISNCSFDGNETEGGSISWGSYGPDGGAIGVEDSSTVIDRCSFTDNYASYRSGAIGCQYGNLTIRNSTFEDNEADYRGGAVGYYADSSSYALLIESTTFTGNTAYGEGGGALSIRYSGNVGINKCIFNENETIDDYGPGFGGAVYSYESDPLFSGCAFTSNTSYYWGGAIYSYSGYNDGMIIDTCAFTGNETWSYGGAVFMTDYGYYITNSTFENNASTDGSGGALVVSGAYAGIAGCTFTGNSAYQDSGAIGGNNCGLDIYYSTFTGNNAYRAGAIGMQNNTDCEIHDSIFTRNIADDRAGAIGSESYSNLHIEGSTFTENEAEDARGGAIGFDGSGSDNTFYLHDSTFTSNRASEGGGAISAIDEADILIDECTFTGNMAEDIETNTSAEAYGGAIYLEASHLDLYDSTFTGNAALAGVDTDDSGEYGMWAYGGAIYVWSGPTLNADGCTFTNNYATATADPGISTGACVHAYAYGGAICSQWDDMYLSDSTITGCYVAATGYGVLPEVPDVEAYGGGVYCYSSDVSIDRCTISDNMTEGFGGGIYFDHNYANGNRPYVANSVISGNSADYGAGIYSGYNSTTMNIVNVTFVDNDAVSYGGALYVEQQETWPLIVVNSLFYNNTAPVDSGSLVYLGTTTLMSIDYCFYNFTSSSDEVICGTLGGLTEGGNSVSGPTATDPGFGTGYELATGSACIDVGDNTLVIGGGDLAHNERVYPTVVDMGAYEYGAPVWVEP